MAATTGTGMAGRPAGMHLPNGGSISAAREGSGLVLLVQDRPELAARMTLELDDSIADAAEPTLQAIAELPGGIVILEDSYASRPGGLSFCQAGEERFLRILDLRPPAKQRLHIKISSCLQSLELDDPGVVWDAEKRTLKIHWLGGSGPKNAEYTVSKNGAARLVNRTQR